jgi:hypothetical protein
MGLTVQICAQIDHCFCQLSKHRCIQAVISDLKPLNQAKLDEMVDCSGSACLDRTSERGAGQ